VGDVNTALPPIDLDKKEIQQRTSELKDIIDQMDLTDVYRVFHPTAA
jgi:hypothetical protein